MTREDLERQVSGICIAASLPITFGGASVSAEATRQILALIDRFEDEKWRPVTEPPKVTEQVDLLFELVLDPHKYVDVWYGYNPGEHWPPREMYQGGRWRVLPQPPKGE